MITVFKYAMKNGHEHNERLKLPLNHILANILNTIMKQIMNMRDSSQNPIPYTGHV